MTQKEESIDIHTASLRFNIELLSMRVEAVTNWLVRNPQTSRLQVGYFGASTGAAVALVKSSSLTLRDQPYGSFMHRRNERC